MFDILISKQ